MGVGFLADSNITKRALASALKELMESRPFAKISISDICEKCDMNRKSFYYHFKDKYDLVNWIYYTEFITVARQKEYEGGWDILVDICAYFYESRDFYRKTLIIEGQNSFSEYYRDVLVNVLTYDLEKVFGEDEALDFYVDFYADAFVAATKRWLMKKDCVTAEEFTRRLKKCLFGTSDSIVKRFSFESYKEIK